MHCESIGRPTDPSGADSEAAQAFGAQAVWAPVGAARTPYRWWQGQSGPSWRWTLVGVLAGTLLALGTAYAGSRTPLGEVVRPERVPQVGGGVVRTWGEAELTVLVFFRPGHDHSLAVLRDVGALGRELPDRSVHWIAIASDRYPAASLTATAKDAEMPFPLVNDAEDRLYANLGLTLVPELAVVGKDGKLLKVVAFAKVNFRELLRAELRHSLHEISDEELKAARQPGELVVQGDRSVARRHIKMAELLLKSGNVAKALESAATAVRLAPDFAAAQSMLGRCYLEKADCTSAVAAFDIALRLDPSDREAAEGKRACAAKAN